MKTLQYHWRHEGTGMTGTREFPGEISLLFALMQVNLWNRLASQTQEPMGGRFHYWME
jgi:hypothetical protein